MSVPLVNDVLGVNVARVYCCFYSSVHKSSPLFFFRLSAAVARLSGLRSRAYLSFTIVMTLFDDHCYMIS